MLQQIHLDQIGTFEKSDAIHVITNKTLRIIYLSETDEDSFDALKAILEKDLLQTRIYTWRPAIVKQNNLSEHVHIERIPEFLVERFGGGAS